MKWKCDSAQGRGNGYSHTWTIMLILETLLATRVLQVAAERVNTPADTIAAEVSDFTQYSFPHPRHDVQPFRRQLSHHEQEEIFTDIQQNHRFQQPPVDPRSPTNSHQHPFSIFQQQQYSQQQERHFIPQQSILNPAEQSVYSPQSQLTHQQTPVIFPQPQAPIPNQQSPILLSLQQSPLSSPQFSALFSQQPQIPFASPNSALSTQPSPVLLSLQNSPLSVHPSKEVFLQVQTPHATQQSPLTTQQSPDSISQRTKSPLSTQQSPLTTQESRENKPNLETETQDERPKDEITKDVEEPKEDTNTEFTIQQSISDPEELKRLQLLELQREQERKERLQKLQEEQLRLIQEQHERRIKQRLEEDKRDEERRLQLQEQLRKVYEEKEKKRKEREQEQRRLIQERKERLLKLQQEEQLRLIQDKERQLKEDEEERLKLIGKEEENEEKQQPEPSISTVTYAEPKPATERIHQDITLQPNQKEKQPRQRGRIVEESDPSIASEELFLQNERQKLYYQLKEAQEQQEKRQHATEEKQQTEESQQVTRNNQRSVNQILQAQSRQPVAQNSKLSQLEEQLHQKQLQEQLQKQFQLQLLQRQDLLRQLKLAVSNAATPTNEDQIAPGPVAISAGNSSAQLFLANGQKIQVVQSPRQGRPLSDSTPRNASLAKSSISSTTQRPSRALFEELTKGVIPPGADFEVIRHKQDGELEEIGQELPKNLPQKKVTFVFLEEQSDGSFKVKGVRGNNNGEPEEDQSSAGEVESIIKQIQEGDLKLPPTSNNPVLPGSVPKLPTSLPPPTYSHYVPQTTANSLSTTSKPKNTIKTVSSNFNIQSQATTTKPKNIIKNISSNINFQPHSGMEIIHSVTFPPLYEVDTLVTTPSAVKDVTQVQPPQTDLQATLLKSPYSVEAHPAIQSSVAHLFPQGVLSPHAHLQAGSSNSHLNRNTPSANIDQTDPQYKERSNTVPAVPTVTQFSSTVPVTTIFPPNKYSPPYIPQYTTSVPKQKFQKQEPFLPTEPSFGNPSLSHSPFFVPANAPKQVAHNHKTLISGLTYASPTTQGSPLTTDKPAQGPFQHHITPTDYNHKERDFQQTVEAPSLQTPTRVSAPPPRDILKEPNRGVPAHAEGSVEYQTKVEAPMSLAEVLKKEGLFAMARFLRQSGLNDMLNDTGPYTVFAPTDKAFRALLVQLGGPDKAEEKFKENPRLLSGLLLHHVIPGAFELSSLQDEMTGVSLAGTQLRVNTYSTQDGEWNDVKVVTINGVRISRDKHDIAIPQGVAHAVDRVMFPLPVGNIVQTLQSDRERRFTRFLRAIQTSGLADVLSGSKVYTVFAPTDRSFSVVDGEDLSQLLTDKEMSRALVLRHTITGTLYSSGMKFYQIRDSMEKGSTISLHKNNGQVKANSANVATRNIPATNGVIHAIDGLL